MPWKTGEARLARRREIAPKLRAQRKEWGQTPTGRRSKLRTRLMYQFGLTLADYEAMLKAQGGLCALCGQPETATRKGTLRALCVDHCHESGRVRGLLCYRCNLAVGLIGDNAEWAGKLAAYLNRTI
jgi:hypothetical protein